MRSSTLPAKDFALLEWAANFDGLIATKPHFGLTIDQVLLFNAAYLAYQSAYAKAVEPSTRTRVTVAEKNQARTDLRTEARRCISIIDGQANVTDAQKIALGINIRDNNPTPVPRPTFAPFIEVISAVGNRVTIRLIQSKTIKRGKPMNVIGATLFSYVGAVPPTSEAGWKFEENITKTETAVQFAQELVPGTKVWITAFWFNRKAESSPAAVPVSTNLPGGSAMARAA